MLDLQLQLLQVLLLVLLELLTAFLENITGWLSLMIWLGVLEIFQFLLSKRKTGQEISFTHLNQS